MNEKTVVWALCGSFCTFESILPRMEELVKSGVRVLPLMSFNAAGLDTRFGAAADWKRRLEQLCGTPPIETLQGAEPLGPKNLAQAMVIAPCTGNSMLRSGRPVVIALSTNDGLAASFENLAALTNRKHYYIVPFAQDDYLKKPSSLQSDFSLIGDTLESALRGRQLGPILNI